MLGTLLSEEKVQEDEMRLNMHDRTPVPKMEKMPKYLIMLSVTLMVLMLALILFVIFYYSGNVVVLIYAIVTIGTTVGICWLGILDLGKSYVEIDGATIVVVEYHMGIKKVSKFQMSDIVSGKSSAGNTWIVRGERNRYANYLVFKGQRNRYLFKIIDCPETRDVFGEYIKG